MEKIPPMPKNKEELTNNKYKKYIVLKCIVCNNEFLWDSKRKNKRKTCSIKCSLILKPKDSCEVCKISNKKLLTVHHKDGNKHNNKTENLQTLCYNDHRLKHANNGFIKYDYCATIRVDREVKNNFENLKRKYNISYNKMIRFMLGIDNIREYNKQIFTGFDEYIKNMKKIKKELKPFQSL